MRAAPTAAGRGRDRAAARAQVSRRSARLLGHLLLLAATVSAVLVATGAHPASATGLHVGGAAMSTLSVTAPCAPAVLVVTPSAVSGGTSRGVVVADVPGECRGRPATIRLFGADGTAVAPHDTGVTLPATSTATLTVPEYRVPDVAGVALTVETWAVATRWSPPADAPAAPVTAGADTVIDSLTWPTIQGGGTQLCVEARVTTTSPTPVVWSIDMHVDQRPFNGEARAAAYAINRSDLFEFTAGTAAGGVLTVVGNPAADQWNSVARIRAGQYVTVNLCNWSAPVPAVDPTLSYGLTTEPPTGSADYACVRSTVSVTGTPQFYAGWRADVDLGPLLAKVTANGRPAGAPVVYGDGGSFLIGPVEGARWRVVAAGGASSGVRDDVSRSFTVCVGH